MHSWCGADPLNDLYRLDIDHESRAPLFDGQNLPPLASRGVVPVRFDLSEGEVAICEPPPTTIAVTRTGGANPGPVTEDLYS